MTPDETQATLAQFHRELARLRNALTAIELEAGRLLVASTALRDDAELVRNILRLARTALSLPR